MAAITDPVLDWTTDPLVQDQADGQVYFAARVNKLYAALDAVNEVFNGARVLTSLDVLALSINGSPVAPFAGFPSAGLPADVGTASLGVASTASRSDHVHAHGNQAGGSLHAVAVAGVSAGFMSAAQAQTVNDFAAAGTAGRLARFSGVGALGSSTVADDGSGNLSGIGALTCSGLVTGGSASFGGGGMTVSGSGATTATSVRANIWSGDGTTSNGEYRTARLTAGAAAHYFTVNSGSTAQAEWRARYDADGLHWQRWTPGAGQIDTPLSLSYTDGSATFANAVTVGTNLSLSSASPSLTVGNALGSPVFALTKAEASTGRLLWRSNSVERFDIIQDSNENVRMRHFNGAGAEAFVTWYLNADGSWLLPADLALGTGLTVPNNARLWVTGEHGRALLSSVTTDATAKGGRLSVQHFTNTEEPLDALHAFCSASANQVDIGGGSSSGGGADGNAATQVSIWTAADRTTITGTERFRIDSSGEIHAITPGGTHRFESGGELTMPQLASAPTPGAGRGSFYPRSSDGAPMYAYGATPTVTRLAAASDWELFFTPAMFTPGGAVTNFSSVEFEDGFTRLATVWGVMPAAYSGGDLLVEAWVEADGAASNTADFTAGFARQDDGDNAGDAVGGTVAASDNTIPGTLGEIQRMTFTLTGVALDSVAGGQPFRLVITRDGVSDAYAGLVVLRAVRITEA